MGEITEEEIIISILGRSEQVKLYDQVIEKYKKYYANEFGYDLENIWLLLNGTYKIMIAIATLDLKISNHNIKMYNNKILKINIEEFSNEYKEYIDKIKETIKELDILKEKLEKEFVNKNNN